MALFNFNEKQLAKKKQDLQNLQEQVDEEKQIADLEKRYREGMTTLKDLIAPSSLNFEAHIVYCFDLAKSLD